MTRIISIPAKGWAMPSARAGRATPRAALRRLGHTATIAIATAAIYFLLVSAMVLA